MRKNSILRAALSLLVLLCSFAPMWGQSYELVTSTADLESGKQYVIVCPSKSMVMGAQSGNFRTGVAVTITDNVIEELPAGAAVCTLKEGNTTGSFAISTDEGYLNYTGSSNTVTSLTSIANSSSWKISITENEAIINNVNSTNRNLRWNNSSPRFACYTTAQTAIAIYKEVAAEAGDPQLTLPEGIESEHVVEFVEGATFDSQFTSAAGSTGDITYSSEKPEVATIDATTGLVTLKGVGTTTITASIAADGSFNADSKSYTLNVVVLKTFVKATTISDGQYIIAYVDDQVAMNTTNDGSFFKNTTITVTDNKIETYLEDIIWTITEVEVGTGKYTITNGNDYVAYTGGKNAAQKISEQNNTSTWTISVAADGIATITNVASTDRVLKYNSGSPRFACYTSGQQSLTLYKLQKEGQAEATISFTGVENGALSKNITDEDYTVNATAYDGAAITYSHDDTEGEVIYTDEDFVTNGYMMFVAPGTVTITASVAETDQYTAASASFTLTINDDRQDPELAFTGLNIVDGKYSVDLVKALFESVATSATGSIGKITYTSSDEAVAKIMTGEGEEGWIELLAGGTTTITATIEATTTHKAGEASYELTVVDNRDPKLAFVTEGIVAEGTYPININESTTFNSAVYSVAGSTGSITYESLDTEVASIDADGVVTLHKVGETMITATMAAATPYNEASLSYILKVTDGVLRDAVIFSQEHNSWRKIKETTEAESSYEKYEGPQILVGSDSCYYEWNFTNTYVSSNSLQMKPEEGCVTSPVIKTQYGFDVVVTVGVNSAIITAEGIEGSATATVGAPATLRVNTPESVITIKAGSSYTQVSEIKIIPLTEEVKIRTFAKVNDGKVGYGDYLLVVSRENTVTAMSNNRSSNVLQESAVVVAENETISTDDTAIIWTLNQQDANYWTINNADKGYIGATSNTSTSIKFVNPGEKTEIPSWTINSSTENTFKIRSVEYTDRYLQYNYNNGNPRFACYKTTSNDMLDLMLYREVTHKYPMNGEQTYTGSYVEKFSMASQLWNTGSFSLNLHPAATHNVYLDYTDAFYGTSFPLLKGEENVTISTTCHVAEGGSIAPGFLYIDWNKDGVFDPATELVAQAESANDMPAFNVDAVTPDGLTAGLYRARFEVDTDSSNPATLSGDVANGAIAVDFDVNYLLEAPSGGDGGDTGIEEVEESVVLYYANGAIYTNLEGEIAIYDLSGKLVRRANAAPVAVDDLENGMYIVRANGKTLKFVK